MGSGESLKLDHFHGHHICTVPYQNSDYINKLRFIVNYVDVCLFKVGS